MEWYAFHITDIGQCIERNAAHNRLSLIADILGEEIWRKAEAELLQELEKYYGPLFKKFLNDEELERDDTGCPLPMG
jgi:hypothetical protein